jgi:hypothetical protein
MLVYLYCYYLLALDSNDTECTEEGEVLEYQEEEDQGQANQGKPSKFVASMILVLLMHDLLLFTKMHGLMYCYCLWIAIIGDSAPRVMYYHPHGMTLYFPTYIPLDLLARWLASWPLINLVVEQKL